MNLAPYAAHPDQSRGRRHAEAIAPNRSDFQRDRDRIVHSSGFRRLVYKTQVFVNHEGDLFRTRLTHSIEVAQIARTIARALHLEEDLVEAISLAHDLGHTPFGHAGQDALNDCMKDFGGFEHNLQSLRVVDELEQKYPSFTGLNLTFETREGILKHCTRKNAKLLGDVGERFLNKQQPGLEAQLANLADEIAYNNHDVDDGLRAGLLTIEQLCEVPLFRDHHDQIRREFPDSSDRSVRHQVVRRMINALVTDLIETSRGQLEENAPDNIDAVRAAGRTLIGFSDEMRKRNTELKRFLNASLYQHHQVYRMSAKARRVISRLFDAFMDDPRLLPPRYHEQLEDGKSAQARAVADYIAGMTDRYALDEYDRIFNPRRLL